MDELEIVLKHARCRLLCQVAIAVLADSVLVSGAFLLSAGCIRVWRNLPAYSPPLLLVVTVLCFLAVAIIVRLRFPSLPAMARLLDRLGNTKDRFITAFRLRDASGAIEVEARHECEEYVRSFRIEEPLPYRVPKRLGWLLAPLVSLALLNAYHTSVNRPTAGQLAAQAAAESRTESLNHLAQALSQQPAPDLQALATQLRQASDRVKEVASRRDATESDAEKAALREISRIESMADAMRRAQKNSPEIAALQEAFKNQESTRPAADSLAKGKRSEAASQIEQVARQASDPELNAIAREITEALKKMGEKQNENGSEMQKQMAAASRGGRATASALEQLAKSLRDSAGSDGRQQSPRENEQALRQLLAALQNMKAGDNGRGSKGMNGSEGPAPAIVFSDNSRKQPMPGTDMGSAPSGRPGSEHDEGTTKTPFGKEKAPEPKAGSTEQIQGELGEGESLQQLITAAGDDSKAIRRYKDLFQTIAGDPENSVDQEEIPLGARVYIKRYFEAIRPKE